MAARKATSRPRTARSRKTKKPPAARKRSTRPARGRRATATRTATSRRHPSRRAKAAKRPAAARKAATRRKKVVARPKSSPVKRKATAATGKKTTLTRRPVRKSTAKRLARPAPPPKAAPRPAPKPRTTARSAPAPVRPAVPPALVRERRQLAELERDDVLAITAGDDRLTASVRSGREELKALLGQHHETSPVLTAGDVDAKWTDAYAVGDEAPGGDKPTPDQDRVDDIGKALGVNYEASEELRGSEKITDRDRHRWELDPASSDDWPHDKE
jgi:hypothetical protein